MTATLPEYDASLTRAGVVHVRRACPSDRTALQALHGRLSAETVHSRYFTAAPNVEAEFDRLLRMADDKHETLVALIADQLVGVACYECVDQCTAEVAFLIDDDHHGLGIATSLLAVLAAAARRHGITTLVADAFVYNLPMLSVFHDSGLRYWTSADADVMHIHVPLDASTDGPDDVHLPLTVGQIHVT
jgi:GNAT superfamily N-acetyltransferase